MFKLATVEPYSLIIHGDGPSGKYIVIYDYDLNEFYSNEWVNISNNHTKKSLSYIRRNNIVHDKIRNYSNIMKHTNKLQIVESSIDSIGRELCILHTYKINLFKRKWRSLRG